MIDRPDSQVDQGTRLPTLTGWYHLKEDSHARISFDNIFGILFPVLLLVSSSKLDVTSKPQISSSSQDVLALMP